MNLPTIATPPPPSELSDHHKAHGPNWSRWLAHLAGRPGVAGLELGTWKGESAEWMLDHVFTGPMASYHCVDTFEGSDEHRLAAIDCSKNERITRERLARFGERATIHKGTSELWLKVFEAEGRDFDFVYVDAAHDAMNVLRDSVLGFERLRPGGILVWDDYEWTVMRDEVDRPKIAIDGFLACYARQIEVIGMGWQVAIRKVA